MDKSDSRNCGSRNIGICGTAEIEDQWDATSSLQCHPQAYQIKKKKKVKTIVIIKIIKTQN